MNSDLLIVLQNVTEWLKFAEAKNTGLIAFNGASIFGLTALLGTKVVEVNPAFWWWVILSIVLLIVSTMVSLLSMIPKLNIVKEGIGFAKIKGGEENMIYFEHLKELDSKKVYEGITCEVFDEASLLDKNLTGQIIQISKVASRKYSHFSIAVWATLFGVFLPVAILLGLRSIVVNFRKN